VKLNFIDHLTKFWELQVCFYVVRVCVLKDAHTQQKKNYEFKKIPKIFYFGGLSISAHRIVFKGKSKKQTIIGPLKMNDTLWLDFTI